MKSKKLKKENIIVGVVLLVVLVGVIVLVMTMSGSADARKFKSEYEDLNGKTAGESYKYQSLKLAGKSKIEYASLDEAVAFANTSTGLIFFGTPTDGKSRSVVETLLESTNCSCLEKVLYVDMTDKFNVFEIEDDKPVETKKAEQGYYDMLVVLNEYLNNYTIVDDDGFEHELQNKRIDIPMVVAVKDGEIVGAHTGSVSFDREQGEYDELDEVQKSELSVIYNGLIEAVVDENATCKKKCK